MATASVNHSLAGNGETLSQPDHQVAPQPATLFQATPSQAEQYQAEPSHAPLNQAAPDQAEYQTVPQWSQPFAQTSFPPPDYFPSAVAPLPRASKYGATNTALWTLLGVAVAIAIGIGVFWKFGHHANYAWQEYKASDDSYTVLMPGRPVESVQSQATPAGVIQMHLSIVEMGRDGAYMVGYADYPSSFTKLSSQDLLDAGAQGAVARSGATLVSRKNITLDGYPGVELELLPPAGQGFNGGHARARIYWVAPRLYILFAGNSKADAEATNTKFLDSFKFSN